MSDKDKKTTTMKDMSYQTLSTLVVKQKKEIKELKGRLKFQSGLRESDLKCTIEREEEIKQLPIEELKIRLKDMEEEMQNLTALNYF